MSLRRTAAMLERQRRAKVERALARPELRTNEGTAERAPCGPWATAKVVDPETRRLIDEALARKGKTP